MLELLTKWAELEPKVIIQVTSVFDLFLTNNRQLSGKAIITGETTFFYEEIEYAVRDAIEARGIHYNQGWNINSRGDYWAMLDAEVDTAYASSPAEAILAAYVEYLENEVQE